LSNDYGFVCIEAAGYCLQVVQPARENRLWMNYQLCFKDRAHPGSFAIKPSLPYADAPVHDQAELSALVSVYALINRMRVLSRADVVESAEAVVRTIIETYFAPNKTFPELRGLLNSHAIDPLRAFSEICRAELQALKAT
jgi:hypothetical protein